MRVSAMNNSNYVDGLELRIKDLTAERNAALAQVEQLRKCLTEASETVGFLSYHLRGRMGVNALTDLAQKADKWSQAAKVGA